MVQSQRMKNEFLVGIGLPPNTSLTLIDNFMDAIIEKAHDHHPIEKIFTYNRDVYGHLVTVELVPNWRDIINPNMLKTLIDDSRKFSQFFNVQPTLVVPQKPLQHSVHTSPSSQTLVDLSKCEDSWFLSSPLIRLQAGLRYKHGDTLHAAGEYVKVVGVSSKDPRCFDFLRLQSHPVKVSTLKPEAYLLQREDEDSDVEILKT